MLTGMLVVLAACIASPAAAWPTGYDYDGFDLLTNESGTLEGAVYISCGNNSGLDSTPYIVGYTGIPTGTVEWAHLYTGVWGGTEDYTGWANITVTNSSGTYDLGPARLNKSNMDASTCCSGNGKWLVCKDVSDYIDGTTLSARATTSGSIDGRVYGIVLAAAVENASGDKIAYWLNVGNVNENYITPVDNTLTWMNGTAYSSSETKIYAMQYVGSVNQNDFLYFNAPDAADSPFNLSNAQWNISKYRKYQLNGDDVADCSQGSYFDLDVFTVSNDSTPLKNIVNLVGNNHLVFWRGYDYDGDGSIEGVWQGSTYEGEVYVSPIMAAMVQKDITRLYDFDDETPGAAGTNIYAYEGEVDDRPPNSNGVPTGDTVTYSKIEADDGDYEYVETQNSGKYAAHRFVITLQGPDTTVSNIEKLTVTWNGKGTHGTPSNNGAYLYIWNNNSGSYEELSNTTSGTDTTLSGDKTSNIGNYINSNTVTVLAVQANPQTGSGGAAKKSKLETDYFKLVIDPDV